MARIWSLILMYWFSVGLTMAQDSLFILSQERFVGMVLQYHPVIRQSELILETGEYRLKKARGNFDPYLYSYLDEKQFEEKEYFSLLGTGLKVPTWVGVDVRFGYDRNGGIYLNPENILPENGLLYGGISVPLGEGLIIDERRKVVRQAQLFSQYTRVEQTRILNDLLLNALEGYWNWVRAYNQLLIYREFIDLALERFDGIRENFEQGEIPAIDTLEAFIQVQNRKIGENQSFIEFQKATLELSNYLWFENDIPLEISDGLVPPDMEEMVPHEALSIENLNSVLQDIENNHPELKLYEYKLADLQIEQRWKKEKIKPTVNINYNFLNEARYPDQEGFGFNNYKWGFEFSMPLLFRSEIGDLRLTQIKLKEAEFGRSQKSLEIVNKVLVYYRQLQNLSDQETLYDENVINYERLLQGERKKFEAGESSLFLINSREVSFIDARIKQMDVKTKTRITHLSYFWASGILLNEFTGDPAL
ncbi:MAG: TolC family protein [Cyclobacteriaceae bacterium]|nr:TolC family protein [Cyclobacteriaceae bacterium]